MNAIGDKRKDVKSRRRAGARTQIHFLWTDTEDLICKNYALRDKGKATRNEMQSMVHPGERLSAGYSVDSNRLSGNGFL